jgi:hypothetical protein
MEELVEAVPARQHRAMVGVAQREMDAEHDDTDDDAHGGKPRRFH